MSKVKRQKYARLLTNYLLLLRKYALFRYIACDIKIFVVPLRSISVAHDINHKQLIILIPLIELRGALNPRDVKTRFCGPKSESMAKDHMSDVVANRSEP